LLAQFNAAPYQNIGGADSLGDHCINLNSDVKIIFLPGSTDAPIYVIF
jgi:hypothetical protein